MIDRHVHLWPHDRPVAPLSPVLIEDFLAAGRARGLAGIVFTEHLFRFRQARSVTDALVQSHPPGELRESMREYFAYHQVCDLDEYCTALSRAKEQGWPVGIGLEVDHYVGLMPAVAELLGGYPLDLVIGSVHWLGLWRFDHLEDPISMARWARMDLDEVYSSYCAAVEDLAASGVCDVLAHLDLVKVASYRPTEKALYEERLAAAAVRHGLAVELSSAGWTKPVGEHYPSADILQRLAAAQVPMTLASDAHGPARVGDRLGELADIAAAAGVKLVEAGPTWPRSRPRG